MQSSGQVAGRGTKADPSLLNEAWKAAAVVFAVGAPLGYGAVGAGLLVLITPFMIIDARRRDTALWGRLGAPLAALVAVSTLSALFSVARTDGLLFSLGLLLVGGASLVGGHRLGQQPAFLRGVFLPVLTVSAAAVSVYVLYQYFDLGVARATGLDVYTNRMGTLLMFSGLLGVGYLMSLRGRARWSAVPYALLVAVAMGATLSRAAWIAAGVGAVLLALRWPRKGLIVLLVAAIASGALLTSQPRWLGRFQSTFSIERNMDRLAMWEASIDIFLNHPVIGTGPTSFLTVGREYVDAEPWDPTASPHNLVLSIAAEMGATGLLAFGWLLAQAGRSGLRLWRQGDPLSLGIAAAALALFVNDLFSQGFYTAQVGSVLWFSLGMVDGRDEEMHGALASRSGSEPGGKTDSV